MVRELSGIDNFEVTSKLVKEAFFVAIEELKLIEPLINETLSGSDILSCLLFDNGCKEVFKFVIINIVRELPGIDNFEVTSKLVKFLKEPLKNETLFQPDKLSCLVFDIEFKQEF